MGADLSPLRRGLAFAVGLLLGGACSSSPDAPAQSAGPTQTMSAGFNETVVALGSWKGGLSDTTPTPPVTLPQSVLTAPNGDNWVCQNTQYDDRKNLDQMLTPGLTAGVMWPGALIQGRELIAGDPAGIPLPRSAITISIDLAVDTPSVRIAAPTSASVQSAIAGLQRQADARLGKIDVVPALIDYHSTEAFGELQAALDNHIYGHFPVEGVDVNASVGVQDTFSFQRHTIAVTLIQPMYTISFADEEKVDPNAYLADSVTAAQVQGVVNRGLIGGDNQPVYVKSVTYGRMLVFTMTNDSIANAFDLQSAISGSVSKYKAGDSLSARLQAILTHTDLHVQAFGGSQDSALTAIRTGNLGRFYTAVQATQAVPLSYRVNYLRDGKVALLGAETRYTRSDCAASGTRARYWHVMFDSVTSTGSCAGLYSDSASIFYGVNNSATQPRAGIKYSLLAQRGVPTKDTTVNKEIVVPMGDGGIGLTALSVFTDSSCSSLGPGSCTQSRTFGGADTLPAVPYRFTHYISLPGSAAGCVAKFYWEVFTEPVLAPPESRGNHSG